VSPVCLSTYSFIDLASVLRIRSLIRIRIHFGRLDPDPNPHLEYVSGSRRAKMIQKSSRCSLLRDEDYSCSLNVLYGGLVIRKLKFFIKKIFKKFQL
jgi:hypothetical protein